MTDSAYPAIYDFSLLPYALGDVLTWNIQTAIRAEDAGCSRCDIYLCVDASHPANVYQRDLVRPENCELFFNELFGAFATHPILGNIHIFRSREALLDHLRLMPFTNEASFYAVEDYKSTVAQADDDAALQNYFLKYVQSHVQINDFAARNGRIPLLRGSRGCEPDIERLNEVLLAGHHTVVIHPRLRKLDAGYAGEHTHHRDSDFLEWYEFLRKSATRRSDVKFVVLGRIHEKPLRLLRLPNVMSLRALGLGLGHELTLMLRADLFIGTSSGFAAFANFSTIPYLVTRMNAASCTAYAIPEGSSRLPFATAQQHLVYGEETSAALAAMLERELPSRAVPAAVRPSSDPVDVTAFSAALKPKNNSAALSSRFRVDREYADDETGYLLWPRIQDALLAFELGDIDKGSGLLRRILANFPSLKSRFPQLIRDYPIKYSEIYRNFGLGKLLRPLTNKKRN
ncbi:hypothetical protein Q8W71_24910 [Methylobacterium sp. NEAU 140]|uniref:hypothetical protein n=1 Tax=Methylobacterium sp. NEAU 140 TaxID=3064945 RepID=UPI00273693A9|nr:hypothetical protein [Methylobacterium sp. NEAU 140]MDP4025877.1 hypothetical protein [Methylobacterium sp. NEAU 140]